MSTTPEFTPKHVALFVYDHFATDVAEVAEHFGVSKDRARKLLKRHSNLFTASDLNDAAQGDRRSGAYKGLTWQTWQTHDDLTREQAAEWIDRELGIALGIEPQPEPTPKPKTRLARDVLAEMAADKPEPERQSEIRTMTHSEIKVSIDVDGRVSGPDADGRPGALLLGKITPPRKNGAKWGLAFEGVDKKSREYTTERGCVQALLIAHGLVKY
jgi:hypothetical protein